MNAKPKIKHKIIQKNIGAPPPSAAGACRLQHVKTLMGLSRRRLAPADVQRLIDTRQVRWAWDISRRGAARPEVRIWRDSLLAYLGREEGSPPAAPDHLSLAQVIEAILPRPIGGLVPRAATVRGPELQKRFLCSQVHLARLIDDGELCRVGPRRPKKAPVVLYQSAVEFLKRRSIST